MPSPRSPADINANTIIVADDSNRLYPFLSENEELKLKTCFFNFLSAHEYELARAVLFEYFRNVSESDAMFMLTFCLENLQEPKNICITSRFKWFCYCTYLEFQKQDVKNYNVDLLSFETLLDSCVNSFRLSEMFSNEVVKQMKYIYSYRMMSKKGDKNSIISTFKLVQTNVTQTQQPIIDLFKEMYEKCPFLASYLEKDAFQIIDGKSVLIDKLEKHIGEDNYELVAYLLRFVSVHLLEDIKMIHRLKAIFQKLIENKNHKLKNREDNLLIDLVYESLFFADIEYRCEDCKFKMTRMFCDFEDQLTSKKDEYALIASNVSLSEFTNYTRVTDKHVLGSVLQMALNAVKSKDFYRLGCILEHSTFSRLKPLVILLSWDELKNDISDRQLLMENVSSLPATNFHST